MGKIHIFTQEQKFILDKIAEIKYFKSNFYFTGGTALSAFYLQHRYSEDMDFFSEKELDNSLVFEFIDKLAKQYRFTFTSQFKEIVYIFNLAFKNGVNLKIDFGIYPHKRVGKGIIFEGFNIDSLLDIAINKLVSINQRATVKDFVDLYFLLDMFSIWDLVEGVKVKFRMKVEPYILAMDLSEAEKFIYMPRMIKPLTLDKLKKFFREKAIELGRKQVEE